MFQLGMIRAEFSW